MFNSLKVAILFALSTGALVSATPVSQVDQRAGRTILGWKGLQRGDHIELIVSGGGELGRVFYIADGTDLAQQFAITGTHVCEITADSSAWNLQPKAWVSQAQINAGGVDMLFPGSVLFASHTAAGLPSTQDRSPWQMGIRQAQLTRLDVRGECFKKTDPKVRHGLKLDYSKQTSWNIQGEPERGP